LPERAGFSDLFAIARHCRSAGSLVEAFSGSLLSPAAPSAASLAERERLLAFSFANADLLLELDADLRVVFASGAIHHLTGLSGAAIIGRPIVGLIEARDRSAVALALGQLQPNTRLPQFATGLVAASGADMPVMLTGYRLDAEGPRFFITIARRARSSGEIERRARADRQTGLLDASDFADVAASAHSAQPHSKVTMIELAGIEALTKRAGEENTDRVLYDAGAVLRAASIQGESAGSLGRGKLVFVHDAHSDTAAIGARITAISRRADPTGAGLAVAQWSLPLEEADLNPEQMSQVLRYAIRTFAERGLQEFKPGSMNEMMQGLVSDTIARITSVKDTIDTGRIGIAYQRIVGMNDRLVHHWEALCRPGDSESPAGVVSFAEQIGLSGEFDLLVCSKVIAAIEKAAEKQLKPSIAINLSARFDRERDVSRRIPRTPRAARCNSAAALDRDH
jgi:predicted signal transduction protein with EAL and GGDEF domain